MNQFRSSLALFYGERRFSWDPYWSTFGQFALPYSFGKGTLYKRGQMRFPFGKHPRRNQRGRAPKRCRNAPHIFFCLGKRKRAAPGTKENRSFSGLLVRPEQMGLVSSSCAKRRALPVRSRRSCFVGCKPGGAKRTRGPSCAAAARPGIRRRFLPAGAYTFFCCPLSGSGAVAQSSPICTNRLFET